MIPAGISGLLLGVFFSTITGFLGGLQASQASRAHNKSILDRTRPAHNPHFTAGLSTLILIGITGWIWWEQLREVGVFIGLAIMLIGGWASLWLHYLPRRGRSTHGLQSILALIGRASPHLALLCLWGMHKTGMQTPDYQHILARLRLVDAMTRCRWYRHLLLQDGGVEGSVALLKIDQNGNHTALRRLADHDHQRAKNLVAQLLHENPDWPEHDRREVLEWALGQGALESRKTALRRIGQIDQQNSLLAGIS